MQTAGRRFDADWFHQIRHYTINVTAGTRPVPGSPLPNVKRRESIRSIGYPRCLSCCRQTGNVTGLSSQRLSIGLWVQPPSAAPKVNASVAQLAEHWFEEPGVVGSKPTRCAKQSRNGGVWPSSLVSYARDRKFESCFRFHFV